MRILGINALNHDAAVCVIEDGEILFGAHSERYSGKKNDPNLNQEIVDEALSFGDIDIKQGQKHKMLIIFVICSK